MVKEDPQSKKFVFDTVNLIKFTWEKKWILISVSVVAFILSTIIAFAIKPLYKSKVVLYPVAEVSLAKSLVETQVGSNSEKDVITFGMDLDAQRLLQVVKSEQLTDHLIKKFDLLNYYKVDQSPKSYPMTTVKGILGSNIKIRRTEFNSIEVQVLDHDPQMAADMANEVAHYTDTLFINITSERAKKAYEIALSEYNNSDQHIRFLTDTLNLIRANGINDYERQAEAFNKAYINALVKNDAGAVKAIEKKLAVLEKYGSKYDEIKLRLDYEIKRLSHLKGKVAAATVNLEHRFPSVFIIDSAVKAEKKDSPKRMVLVAVSTLSAFAFSLLVLLILNNFKGKI